MAISNEGIVSIMELVVYSPTLILAALATLRLRWRKCTAWIYVSVLCLLRILGPICQLVSDSQNHPSHGLVEATLILDFIGLSPLLFATLSLVSRASYWIGIKGGDRSISQLWFWIVHSTISAAAVLCIVGGAGDNTATPSTKLKAGVLVYVASFVAVSLLFLSTVRHHSLVPTVERRIFLAVAIAWPFILVRLLYSIIADFGHDSRFAVIGGSVGIRVGMAIVEEFVVVVDYVILGHMLKRIVRNEPPPPRSNNRPLPSPRAY